MEILGRYRYADSNHGGNMVKRKLLMCYIYTQCRCAVSWNPSLQDIVALSITKSVYMSMIERIKEEI